MGGYSIAWITPFQDRKPIIYSRGTAPRTTRTSSGDGRFAPRSATETVQADPVVVQLCLASVLVGCTGAFQVFAPGGAGAILVFGPLVLACWLLLIHVLSPVNLPSGRSNEVLPLVLLVMTPGLSILWSTHPAKSLNDALTIFILGILGITVSKFLSFEARLKVIGTVLAVLVLISILVVFVAPSVGIDNDTRADAWRGIFLNKNSLGRVAAIELLVTTILAIRGPAKNRPGWFGIAGISLVTVLNSDSQTALIGVLAALVVLIVTSKSRFRRTAAKKVGTVIIGIYLGFSVLIPVLGPLIATFFTRDPTLTGRTTLWAIAEGFAAQKPLLGWGFGAVWQTEGGIGLVMSQALTFVPGSAHNGLLDLRLQNGLLGVVLVIIALWLLLVRSLSNQSMLQMASAQIAYVTLLLTMDLTESTLYFGLTWFLMWIFLTADRQTRM